MILLFKQKKMKQKVVQVRFGYDSKGPQGRWNYLSAPLTPSGKNTMQRIYRMDSVTCSVSITLQTLLFSLRGCKDSVFLGFKFAGFFLIMSTGEHAQSTKSTPCTVVPFNNSETSVEAFLTHISAALLKE